MTGSAPAPRSDRSEPVAVAVVEDDLAHATAVGAVLAADGDILVVAAVTGEQAAAVLRPGRRPDVAVVDVTLERGSAAVVGLLEAAGVRVVAVVGGVRGATGEAAEAAIAAGAADVLPRPARYDGVSGRALRAAVRAAARLRAAPPAQGSAPVARRAAAPRPPTRGRSPRRPVVAIGASTGGPPALAVLLPQLAGLGAPIVVVQHMAAGFALGFVDWLAGVAGLPVVPAVAGQALVEGVVHVAVGEAHTAVTAGRRLVQLEAPASPHRPSVDVLFRSVASVVGPAGVAVLLTGMGEDGVAGLAAVHAAGGRTLAQDEASSAVWGMPGAAVRRGVVHEVLPLDELGAAVRRATAQVEGR